MSEKKYIACFGFYDGVHLGHKVVLKELINIAKTKNLKTMVISFDKKPLSVIKNFEIDYILTTNEKINKLTQVGIDKVEIVEFTKQLSQLSYIEFFEKVLLKNYKIEALVFGYDTTIGRNREGTFEKVQALAKQHGISCIQTEALVHEETNISSSRIREAIESGQVGLVKLMLGYNHFFYGRVVKGRQIGRDIGFPTANLELKNKVLPKTGVFGVKVIYNGKEFYGMMNIGVNPSVSDANSRTLEVNIFDLNSDLYGEILNVEFLFKIRDEKKFSSLEELTSQLKKDKEYCLGQISIYDKLRI
jgi:riboflavin kinase/FMN adenylyltransferase